MAQNAGAHHRRKSQRDDGGDDDGDRQGHGELAEEAANHISHEEQGDEHGDQRDSQRNNGEADLLRALQGRLHRRIAFFQIAGDVLDHHDGIVHHEAGGDGQRHQREVVEAIAERIHGGEGADNGQRHSDAGNDGGVQIAQEDKDHHHHQGDGQHQLKFNVGDRGLDARWSGR